MAAFISYLFDRTHLAMTAMVLLTVPSASVACPNQCTCNPAAKSVVCTSAGVSSLTVGLPADTEHLAIKGSYSRSLSFQHLTKNDLSIFPRLKTLVISHTSLTTVDKDALSGVKLLTSLDLSFNRIDKLEAGTFNGLDSLRFLHLTGNEGCQLQPGVFQGLPILLELYLGSMKLGAVNPALFAGLDGMVALDLSNNDLQKVPVDFVDPTLFRSLEVLDLSLNQLSGLPRMLEPLLQRVGTVKLADNPWHCSCAVLWLRNYPNHIAPGHGPGTIICNSPDNVKYDSLAHLASQRLVCVAPAAATCQEPDPLTEGETLRVHCHLSGDPRPDVSWTLPDGSKVTGNGDAGRGVVVNVTGDDVELTVLSSLALNGTLQIASHNLAGLSQSEVQIIVWPITTTTTTTTTTSTSTTTTTPTSTTTPTTTSTTTTTTTPTTTSTPTTPTTTSTTTTRTSTTTTTPTTTLKTTMAPKATTKPTTSTTPTATPTTADPSTTRRHHAATSHSHRPQVTVSAPAGKKADTDAESSTSGNQKTLIFAGAAVASAGLISAAVVAVVLYKALTAISNKVNPVDMPVELGENQTRDWYDQHSHRDTKRQSVWW